MVCSAAVAVSTVANGELLLAPSPLLSRSWAPAPPLQLLAVLSLSSLWSRWSPLALPPAPHSHCCPWLKVALNGGRGIIARISMHIAKHSCSIWPLFLLPAVVAAGHGGSWAWWRRRLWISRWISRWVAAQGVQLRRLAPGGRVRSCSHCGWVTPVDGGLLPSPLGVSRVNMISDRALTPNLVMTRVSGSTHCSISSLHWCRGSSSCPTVPVVHPSPSARLDLCVMC